MLPVVLVSAILAPSCIPYVEEPPVPGPDVARNAPGPNDQNRELTPAERQAEREREQREEDRREAGDESGSRDTTPEIKERAEDPEPPAPDPQPRTRVARAVPGKPGFVFSPFNNKIIDVKGIPSGTLVQDPTYPTSDKKYFRVP